MITLTGKRQQLRELYVQTIKQGSRLYYFKYDIPADEPLPFSHHHYGEQMNEIITLDFFLNEEPDSTFESKSWDEFIALFPEWAEDLEIEFLRGLL